MTSWYQQASLLLVVAFIVTILAEAFVVTRGDRLQRLDPTRLFGLTVVVFLGVFGALNIANDKNSAAAFGLLGAVGGFVVAKSERESTAGSAAPQAPPPA